VITYQQEFLATCRAEAQPLLERHWMEIALNRDTIRLNPDWDAYEELEAADALKIFTARKDGRLIGYFAVLVRRHLHYVDHLFAFNDVLFLDSEYRRGFVGAKLMRFAESCLKEDGVSVMIVNTKTHRPFDALLRWLGFRHIENIYSKVL
jgi:GNAT superfamily N-acetyltransferase